MVQFYNFTILVYRLDSTILLSRIYDFTILQLWSYDLRSYHWSSDPIQDRDFNNLAYGKTRHIQWSLAINLHMNKLRGC